jgi:hypothetical protein
MLTDGEFEKLQAYGPAESGYETRQGRNSSWDMEADKVGKYYGITSKQIDSTNPKIKSRPMKMGLIGRPGIFRPGGSFLIPE